MNLNELQERCYLTAKYPPQRGIEYCILGLCGEAGEVANNYKKIIRDCLPNEHDTDAQKVARLDKTSDLMGKIKEELGDVLWYVATTAREFDWTLEDVANAMLSKLQARHG